MVNTYSCSEYVSPRISTYLHFYHSSFQILFLQHTSSSSQSTYWYSFPKELLLFFHSSTWLNIPSTWQPSNPSKTQVFYVCSGDQPNLSCCPGWDCCYRFLECNAHAHRFQEYKKEKPYLLLLKAGVSHTETEGQLAMPPSFIASLRWAVMSSEKDPAYL